MSDNSGYSSSSSDEAPSDANRKILNKWSTNGFGQKVPTGGKYTPVETMLLKRSIEEYCNARKISVDQLCSDKSQKQGGLRGAWMDIARNLPHRTCQSVYRKGMRVMHPFKRGAWSEQECRSLQELVMLHGRRFTIIQNKLNRSADSCRDKFREINEHYVKGRWDDADTMKLRGFVRDYIRYELKRKKIRGVEVSEDDAIQIDNIAGKHGIIIPWEVMSKKMVTRSRLSCLKKWEKLIARRDNDVSNEISNHAERNKNFGINFNYDIDFTGEDASNTVAMMRDDFNFMQNADKNAMDPDNIHLHPQSNDAQTQKSKSAGENLKRDETHVITQEIHDGPEQIIGKKDHPDIENDEKQDKNKKRSSKSKKKKSEKKKAKKTKKRSPNDNSSHISSDFTTNLNHSDIVDRHKSKKAKKDKKKKKSEQSCPGSIVNSISNSDKNIKIEFVNPTTIKTSNEDAMVNALKAAQTIEAARIPNILPKVEIPSIQHIPIFSQRIPDEEEMLSHDHFLLSTLSSSSYRRSTDVPWNTIRYPLGSPEDRWNTLLDEFVDTAATEEEEDELFNKPLHETSKMILEMRMNNNNEEEQAKIAARTVEALALPTVSANF